MPNLRQLNRTKRRERRAEVRSIVDGTKYHSIDRASGPDKTCVAVVDARTRKVIHHDFKRAEKVRFGNPPPMSVTAAALIRKRLRAGAVMLSGVLGNPKGDRITHARSKHGAFQIRVGGHYHTTSVQLLD